MTAKVSASADGLKVTIGNAAEDALEINQTAKTIKGINGYSLNGNGPAFSAMLNVQSAAGNLTFTSYVEEFDTNNCFDPETGKFQPTIAGYYQFTGAVQTDPVGVAFRAYLTKNQIDIWYGPATGVGTSAESVAALIYLNGTTDHVQMGIATIASWSTFSGAGISFFQGFLVRAA